jgi:poly-gamma-glutamate synthesis protein (capsule biosynthesis protein)
MGDLMLGRSVNPKPNSLAYLFADLSGADLALANLESPLAPSFPATDSSYNLCASSNQADLLSAWGFDLLSLANNHRLDCSLDGTASTQTILENVGIISIGPDMQPIYREVNGLQLAFLAFEDVSSSLDTNAAVEAIGDAADTGAVVIVSIHWGAEYQGGATERQKFLAQKFSEAGAALIWGHHPHVLQPAEWIRPPTGSESWEGSTLVLYSLGNALFDQGGLDDTRRSAMVEVRLDAKGVTGIQIFPFSIDIVNSRIIQPDAETVKAIGDRFNLP